MGACLAQDVTKRNHIGSGNREEAAMVNGTNEMMAEVCRGDQRSCETYLKKG